MQLAEVLIMKHRGTPILLVGVEIHSHERAVCLRQKGLIDKFFQDPQMKSSEPVKTPRSNEYRSHGDGDGTSLSNEENSGYHRIVDRLIYIALTTRPELCVAAIVLSPRVDKLQRIHMVAARRTLHYLNRANNWQLALKRDDGDQLVLFAD